MMPIGIAATGNIPTPIDIPFVQSINEGSIMMTVGNSCEEAFCEGSSIGDVTPNAGGSVNSPTVSTTTIPHEGVIIVLIAIVVILGMRHLW